MAQKLPLRAFPDKPRGLTIGAELNRGAWGIVYEGEWERCPVAVKGIHRLLQQEGGRKMRKKLFEDFQEECMRLQKLSHPHVVGKRNLRNRALALR